MELSPFTVLLLRPDYQHDGHPSDWLARHHVNVAYAKDAGPQAIHDRIVEEPDLDPDDLAVLAVFEGHHKDVYQPDGE